MAAPLGLTDNSPFSVPGNAESPAVGSGASPVPVPVSVLVLVPVDVTVSVVVSVLVSVVVAVSVPVAVVVLVLVSVHVPGAWPMHTPLSQKSFDVHASPSSHPVPSAWTGLLHTPVAESHVPTS